MAEKGIILPSGPLFMVDKSWNLQSSFRTNNKGEIESHSRDVVKVLKVVKNLADTQRIAPLADARRSSFKSPSNHPGFQFVAATEPGGRQDKDARQAVRKHARRYDQMAGKSSRRNSPIQQKSITAALPLDLETGKPELPVSTEMVLERPVAFITSPLYGFREAQKAAGLEAYLNYYCYKLASSTCPLEQHVPFDFNPIRGTCFPLALSDRLYLETIILTSVVHHSIVTNVAEPNVTDKLARSVLSELRRRIVQRDISDATLLSVSCIALLENALGNHDQWGIHAAGMKDMVNFRGVNAIDPSVRWKVYRADIVGAIDRLTKPLLPSPSKDNLLEDFDIDLADIRSTHLLSMLKHSVIGNSLQSIFCHICRLLGIIKHAIERGKTISSHSVDENCIYIQHSLLQIETDGAIEESCKISCLIFMNTMNRSGPFTTPKCTLLSRRLKLAFEEALPALVNERLTLWLAVMGGLVSAETKEHKWFIQTLTHLVHSCECRSWNDVRQMLSDILWLDPLHDEFGSKLWEEVLTVTAFGGYNLA